MAAFVPIPDATIAHVLTETSVNLTFPRIPAIDAFSDVTRKRARTTDLLELVKRNHPHVTANDIAACVLKEFDAVAVAHGGFPGMPPWAVQMMNTINAIGAKIDNSNAALQAAVHNLGAKMANGQAREGTNSSLQPLLIVPPFPVVAAGAVVPLLPPPAAHQLFPADYDALTQLTAPELRSLLAAYGVPLAPNAARDHLRLRFKSLIGVQLV